jgi:hypothetical protein
MPPSDDFSCKGLLPLMLVNDFLHNLSDTFGDFDDDYPDVHTILLLVEAGMSR